MQELALQPEQTSGSVLGIAAHGVTDRLQVDPDLVSAPRLQAQPLGVTPDYADGQGLAQPVEFLYPNPVLETRQCRLRRQIAALDRIAG